MRAKEYEKFYGRLAIEAQSTKVVNLPAKSIGNSEKERLVRGGELRREPRPVIQPDYARF